MAEQSEGQYNKPGETPQPSLADTLQPGNIIEFADLTELTTFEDILAEDIEPMYDPIKWATRLALRDLIRPPKFNGTIADVRLEVMAEPYERLQDAPKRGWNVGPGNYKLSSEVAQELIARYRGFTLTATPKSSRPGRLGQIQAELWYYPVPVSIHTMKEGTVVKSHNELKSGEKSREYAYLTKRDYTYLRKNRSSSGESVRRVVTKPRVETERFIEHDAAARRIGFQLLRQQMMHPITTPMQE
jgi:hypothetical protein